MNAERGTMNDKQIAGSSSFRVLTSAVSVILSILSIPVKYFRAAVAMHGF